MKIRIFVAWARSLAGPMVANDGLIPLERIDDLEMSRIYYARPIFYYVHKPIHSIQFWPISVAFLSFQSCPD
jgi:hypothetical protein